MDFLFIIMIGLDLFELKGYFTKKILWLNLIFWDMMGCGTAHFGRMGLETTQTEKKWSKILSLGGLDLRRK